MEVKYSPAIGELFIAAAKTAGQRVQRRRRQPAEKRRLVELTLRAGVSLREIAREHGLHPSNLRAWKALYRAGKLEVPAQSTTRVEAKPASATFVPVSIGASSLLRLRSRTRPPTLRHPQLGAR